MGTRSLRAMTTARKAGGSRFRVDLAGAGQFFLYYRAAQKPLGAGITRIERPDLLVDHLLQGLRMWTVDAEVDKVAPAFA